MKMHCADVLLVLRAFTAACTVLYFPELPTVKHPAGAVVRTARGVTEVGAATAVAASEKTSGRKVSILTQEEERTMK